MFTAVSRAMRPAPVHVVSRCCAAHAAMTAEVGPPVPKKKKKKKTRARRERPAALTLTQAAAARIQEMLEDKEDAIGVRLGTRTRM